jgi:hypothetical protein
MALRKIMVGKEQSIMGSLSNLTGHIGLGLPNSF